MNDESQKALFAALAAAQSQMRGASKDRKNEHMRYRYATLESVIDAVRDPLSSNGICHWSEVSTTERAVAVCVYLAHKEGGTISTRMEVPIEVEKGLNSVQVAGKAITYMRRYGLMALCGISASDDDDDASSVPRREQREEQAPPAKKPAQDFVAAVLDRCNAAQSADAVKAAREWARQARGEYELGADALQAVKSALDQADARFASPIDVDPEVPQMGK